MTYVPLPNVNGTSTAVWEVTNATPGAPAQLNFPVAVVYNSGTSTTNPVTTGSLMVTQEYAPTPASLAFTATAGAAPSGALTIPRFNDTGAAKALGNLNACRTVLLFPFVATTAGFETGLAISNTSQDPFGTSAQAGTCSLNFYGSGAPSPAPVTPSVAAGTTWANNTGIGLGVTNFAGYLIAVCNFQYGHGYAAIFNGFGTSAGVFSSYLAEVIPDPGTTIFGRPATSSTGATNAEILAH
ncbi:MAG: hypothetical protein JO336_14240 [Acidobacteriia bacterium]|nr:hypothetical protein [Terriglobia bacterium]